ncbi:sugar transferase [Salaquimonas pukyongi]|uniref:sugar transferase n=1 Tax=Salaquimonas pukyongi TaxID=2712698 RepID=UPI00096BB87E|nr:sugar transferase [Salaquimonas pukyongi]
MKRLFDIAVSSLMLVVLAPVMAAIGAMIWINMGRPVLFAQVRPGLNGTPFKMLKFRTMTNEKDRQNNLLVDGKRLTRLGKWLRANSLDELPELWNVLKGEMSLVGPRPLLMEYLPLYNQRQMRRHEVRPGITGWAQVNGRNAISWEEKFELDIWYVDNRSFLLDLKIIVLTILRVFSRKGISADGEATMPRFRG